MQLAQLFIFGVVLLDERRFALLVQQRGRDRHRAAGVEHMHHRLSVMLRDFHRRMRLARRRAADEERDFETGALHLFRDVHHLIERRRDESAEADQVRVLLLRASKDFVARHHHAHVDDLVVITRQHHADDILADVVDIAFHRCQHDLALRFHGLAARDHRRLFRLHERRQIRDRLLHHARRFHDLRQEHFPRAKQIADHAHPRHQRSFDD